MDAINGPLLACSNLGKKYGGILALSNVDWGIYPGEVHALCGENGAGKSTLARICSGIVRPDSGELRLDGRIVEWSGPDDARRAGVGIILQELDLFAGLSIGENIALGNPRIEPSIWTSRTGLDRAVRPFLDQVHLEVAPSELLGNMSVAQWQLVAIARSLSLGARVIFMDEPTSALTSDSVARLFGLIERLKSGGVAIVYVSHKMEEIFCVSDRITVMREGKMISTRPRAETSIGQVIFEMVGRPVAKRRSIANAKPRMPPLIQAMNLSNARLRGVSFCLSAGEILGVAGLVGSGRSELGRLLCGKSKLESGSIQMNGSGYAPRGVRDAVEQGLVLVPDDRRQGLVMGMSVRENTTLACLRRFACASWINETREAAAVEEALSAFHVKRTNDDVPVSALSGGNQQKVLLCKWLITNPLVCYLDDPTRGIDIGAKDEIYRLMADLASRGLGIIWVSSELPELLANAQRVLVLHEGRCTGILDGADATQEGIMQLATGMSTRPA